MKPLDPRLLRAARATRWFLVLTTVVAAALAALVVAQAVLLARVITAVFLDGAGPAEVADDLWRLAGVVVARGALTGLREGAARVAAGRVKADLRRALLAKVVALGPDRLGRERRGELTTLATSGVDAFDPWFSGYLPQLVQSVVMPLVLVAWILPLDPTSAAILVVTLPMIPVLMALVGVAARARTERQWALLGALSTRFADAVAGLADLRLAGRAGTTRVALAELGERHRRTTLSALRVAFLSSLVLELFATIATAVIAVAIGLRVVHGGMELEPALTVLILAPEVYLPLRLVGTRFHASMDALTAGDRVFAVLEEPDAEPPADGGRPLPDPARSPLVVDGVGVTRPDRTVASLAPCSFVAPPGSLVAVVGPSGAGKSTLLGVLAGAVPATTGRVLVGDVDRDLVTADTWRARVAWIPQHPHLLTASVADNLRLARPDASAAELWSALAAVGLDDVVDALPGRLDAPLGEGGAGLSAGQRHRVALARALVSRAPLVLLDEPTAELDATSSARVATAVAGLAGGRTVVVATHDPLLVERADVVVELLPVAVPVP